MSELETARAGVFLSILALTLTWLLVRNGSDVRTETPVAHALSVPAGLRNDDELALHERDQVLGRVEIAAVVVIEDRLDLTVVEHELEHIQLIRC